MPRRIKNRVKFWVERAMVRGAHYRLLLIAALIGLVSLVAGLTVRAFGPGFDHSGEAIWWAFLRLTDPGYLGDDQGALLRVVSTIVTVLGYVLFLGALIAILTQWLNETLRRLESGVTPLALRDHVLVLGWSNRTATIVRELLLSEGRVRRFLRRHGARSLRVVVLAEEVSMGLVQELRDRLGDAWDERTVILRSGTPLRSEHLERVDFMNAAAIVLPGGDFTAGGVSAADTRAIKVLLSVTSSFARAAPGGDGRGGEERQLPLVVAEMFDGRKIPVARSAYAGKIEILASDAMISRLIAQNVRHSGLSRVYGELLTHGRGNEIYIRECPELTGERVQDLVDRFPTAVLLGVVRRSGSSYSPVLNPPPGVRVERDDRLVLLARSYDDSAPAAHAARGAGPTERGAAPPPEGGPLPTRRVLVIGWNHKVPALLREFDSYPSETFEVDVLSALPVAEREQRLAQHDLDAGRLRTRQLEGDYTASSVLSRLDLLSYRNIVLLASDWLESGEESDARTILGYLLVRGLLPETGPRPDLLVELMDPGNVALFHRRPGEVLISPLILSHMLAQIALRRELRAVFDELFGPGGAEFHFRGAAAYGRVGLPTRFRDLQYAAALRGETALGVRLHAQERGPLGGVHLNPPPDQTWTLTAEDELVVVTS